MIRNIFERKKMANAEKLENLLDANLALCGQIHILRLFYENDKKIVKSLNLMELKLLEAIIPLLDEKENLSDDDDKDQLEYLHKRQEVLSNEFYFK